MKEKIMANKLRFSRKIFLMCTIMSSFFSSCATMGNEFSFNDSKKIIVGKTNQSDILYLYGKPFRAGYENGNKKWTYGYYQYNLFGVSQTKDLAITFDSHGIVTNYTYSSSAPEDVKQSVGH